MGGVEACWSDWGSRAGLEHRLGIPILLITQSTAVVKSPNCWESGREDRLSPGAWRREWPQSTSWSRVAGPSPGLQPHRSCEAVEVRFLLLSVTLHHG